LDMNAVKKDMKRLLTDSQECWPADYGNYGPFFIRLAWHCSGSHRQSDGKAHGACPAGAGPSPKEAYASSSLPWPGMCGTGKGDDTFTSGFEGPWTTRPTKWDNEFYQMLLGKEWEKHTGPGGHWQWRIKDAAGPLAGLIRLTSDMALLSDPEYLDIVKEFSTNMRFNEAFDSAWFKLTTTNGSNRWSEAAKCDVGILPEEIKNAPVMLGGDAPVAV